MPPQLSDIMCGFVRHITSTPENIILLIYSGCLWIPVLSVNGKFKMCIYLFVSTTLLISHGFFLMLSQLLEKVLSLCRFSFDSSADMFWVTLLMLFGRSYTWVSKCTDQCNVSVHLVWLSITFTFGLRNSFFFFVSVKMVILIYVKCIKLNLLCIYHTIIFD